MELNVRVDPVHTNRASLRDDRGVNSFVTEEVEEEVLVGEIRTEVYLKKVDSNSGERVEG